MGADETGRITESLASRARATTLEVSAMLQRAGIETEALAEFVPEGRRLWVLPRPATMRAIGNVWRLGSLLLDTNGGLWAAGKATRAAERGRVGYQSLSREERRDVAAAALRGGYAVGASVNYGAIALPLDGPVLAALDANAPIGVAGDELRVRWRTGASLDGAQMFESYLRERASLLITPPLAST